MRNARPIFKWVQILITIHAKSLLTVFQLPPLMSTILHGASPSWGKGELWSSILMYTLQDWPVVWLQPVIQLLVHRMAVIMGSLLQNKEKKAINEQFGIPVANRTKKCHAKTCLWNCWSSTKLCDISFKSSSMPENWKIGKGNLQSVVLCFFGGGGFQEITDGGAGEALV